MQIDSRRILTHNNCKYVIVRMIRDDENPIIDSWNSFLNTDIALKHNGVIHFCRLIQEPDELEYITTELTVTDDKVEEVLGEAK